MIEEDWEDDHGPSKSQRKRDAHSQQALGERLAALKPRQLESLDLSEILLEAIAEFQRLPNSHGARRRQLQFIGKLMREIDIDPILEQLQEMESPHAASKPQSAAEAWLEKLLAEGNEAIQQLLEEHSHLDMQKLRQLHRNIAKSTKASDKDKHSNRLRSYLSELL